MHATRLKKFYLSMNRNRKEINTRTTYVLGENWTIHSGRNPWYWHLWQSQDCLSPADWQQGKLILINMATKINVSTF